MMWPAKARELHNKTVSSRAEHEGAAADLDERIDADISKLSLDT